MQAGWVQSASYSLVKRGHGGIVSGGCGKGETVRQADPEAAEAGGVASDPSIRGEDAYAQRSDRIDSGAKRWLILCWPHKRLGVVHG